MRRLIVAAALIASGAVFAADLAKDRFHQVRALYPNSGVAASAAGEAEYSGRIPKPAPAIRFRPADALDADMTYDAAWRVPNAFGYHPPAFGSPEPDPAPADDLRFRSDSPPRESRGAPRVQF